MKRSFWNRRIPSIIALFIIVAGIGFTSLLIQTGVIPFLKAAPSETPTSIRITNINDTSFTVSFITEANVPASCSVKEAGSKDQQVQLDERDTPTGILTPHHIHSIVVKNLKANIQYTFSILSGGTTYLDNGRPFSITTGGVISANPLPQNPIIGKLILPSGDNPQEGLIYATAQGGQTISSLIKPNGTYILPLTGMRTDNLSSYINFVNIKNIQLLAETLDLTSQITASLQASNPLPLITVGNDYDFTLNTNPLPTTASASGLPTFFTLSTNATPEIDVPSQNQNFTDPQPLLRGHAAPNSKVSISIHSPNVLSATVTTDAYGNWIYRPPQLAPGTHTITISALDNSGFLQTIQQTFSVLESGTQVAEAATPSATIVPPTPTQIITQTPSPTLIPTSTTVPTATPTIITPTATPTAIILPTTPPTGVLGPTQPPGKLPPTGNNSAIPTAVAGIVTTAIGIGIFIITKGAL